MLFLYRPRETWMPFARPLSGPQQAAYNRKLQQQFESTRRVPRPAVADRPQSALPTDTVGALRELGTMHASGMLTEAEFAQAKAKVLAS